MERPSTTDHEFGQTAVEPVSGSWQAILDGEIERCKALQRGVRRRLHAIPEPSGEEFQTTQFLAEVLRSHGFLPHLGPGNRGLMVDLPRPRADRPDDPAVPCIALRADIDALRIQDAKSVDYRSGVPGIMHACGHDGHTSVVLGALLALQGAADSLPWPVRVRAILQPEEETGTGARSMIEAGALEGVSTILSVHMDPSRALGRIGLRPGELTANCDDLYVHIEGRGGHAARPHESCDPIAAAAQLINAIYLFIPRAVNSQDPAVVTIGQVKAGDNANVIPETAELFGTVRTLSPEVRCEIRRQLEKLACGTAELSGTRIDLQLRAGCPSVLNSAGLTALLRIAARDVVGEGQVDTIPRPSMGGEDFAFYLDYVPGAMFRLGCGPASGQGAPLHSAHFDLDERALGIGAKILARAVVHWSEPGTSWPGR